MPINDNKPTVFDAIITEITKNFSEVVDGIRQDYSGEPKEGYVDEPDEEGTGDTPENTEKVPFDIDDTIVRLLEKAEAAADNSYDNLHSGEYLSIVDRLMILRREV